MSTVDAPPREIPPIATSASPSGRPKRPVARQLSGLGLAALVIVAAVAAIQLHRNGHSTGDDFALYINQARSLFEGNVAQVITDNRFLWKNSVAVTPQIYPWGFPILLSPFVRVWGISAYDRLKLVEVAALCIWLVLFHGIVRRRAGRIVAFAITAGFATAPIYLMHTDQLLTEFPHMMAIAVVIWWLDRIMLRHRLTAASTRELIVLGLLMVAAYNVRRESIVLLFALAATQLVDLLADRPVVALAGSTRERLRRGVHSLPWRQLGTPFLTFGAGAFLFQLMLPSTLVPDNGNSTDNITDRLFTDYPKQLTLQLGLGGHPVLGKVIMAMAAAGAVIACIRRPRLNVPLAAMTAATMLVVGTHFRMVGRYYYQVTPVLVFFATILLLSYVELFLGTRRLPVTGRRVLLTVLAAPALWVGALHVWALPARVDAANRYNDSGAVQAGGLTPITEPMFAAIEQYTHQDDVIVYYRVRSMTLYTDRRGVQTSLIDKAARLGDYFMQRLSGANPDYSQPKATEADLLERGWVVVWEDENWRLWEIVP